MTLTSPPTETAAPETASAVHDFRKWAQTFTPQIAFTGTFRQSRHFDSDATGQSTTQYLTPELAEQTVKQFIERSSRAVFKRSGVRQGQSLTYFGMIEGADNLTTAIDRLHVHLGLFGFPEPLDTNLITDILTRKWQERTWAYTQVDVRPAHDPQGWMDYTLKSLSLSTLDRVITNQSFQAQ